MANVNDLIRKAARGAFKRRARALQSKAIATADEDLFGALKHLAHDGLCPFPVRQTHGLVTLANEHFEAMGMPLAYQDGSGKGGDNGQA